MKILVFNEGFKPAQKYGGPVTSLANFVYNLGDEHDIDIVCSNHDLGDPKPLPGIKPGFNSVGKAQVLYISENEKNSENFISIIKSRKPDLLYLSSIFSAKMNVPLLKIAKKQNLKVVYAPRGELLDSVLKLKWFKKQVFLFAMRLSGLYNGIFFHATSEPERKATVQRLKVPEENVFLISEFPSRPVKKDLSSKQPGSLRIVSISRIHKSKNLITAIKSVLNLSGEITFDIYGPIEHTDYWAECEKLIETAPPNVKIKYCGRVEMDESLSVFSKYDCFLFPTISENYSHSIAEAILAGAIPVISRGTTPWDDIDSRGGFTIPVFDTDGFTLALQKLCDMDNEKYAELSHLLNDYKKSKLDVKSLVIQYDKMFDQVIKK